MGQSLLLGSSRYSQSLCSGEFTMGLQWGVGVQTTRLVIDSSVRVRWVSNGV